MSKNKFKLNSLFYGLLSNKFSRIDLLCWFMVTAILLGVVIFGVVVSIYDDDSVMIIELSHLQAKIRSTYSDPASGYAGLLMKKEDDWVTSYINGILSVTSNIRRDSQILIDAIDNNRNFIITYDKVASSLCKTVADYVVNSGNWKSIMVNDQSWVLDNNTTNLDKIVGSCDKDKILKMSFISD